MLGTENPDTLTSMVNFAHIWKDQGCDKEAMALVKEYVQLRGRVLGPNNPHALSSREALVEWEMKDLDLKSSSSLECWLFFFR